MSSSIIDVPRKLPLLIVGNQVLLPGASTRIPIAGHQNMVMVREHLLKNNDTLTRTIVGIVSTCRRFDDINSVQIEDESLDLHPIGTAAVVVQITGTNWPRPSHTLLVTGLCRFRLVKLVQLTPFRVGLVEQLDKISVEDTDADEVNDELSSLVQDCREKAVKLLDMLDVSLPVAAKLKRLLSSVPSHNLADICSSIVNASYDEKLEVLSAVDLTKRFRKTLPLLQRQLEGLQLLRNSRMGKKVVRFQDNFDSPVRMKKLGNQVPQGLDSQDADDIAELEKNLEAAKMPEAVHKVAMKELQRLKRMMPQMPEYSITRVYLELMSELPWSRSSNQTLDIRKARKDLDDDHYAMENVKKRVIEYLAVGQLKNSLRGPILCFVGPPGVGKTSIGRAIASTLGREFHRMALGGVCDQSDIRGHRRTYIGAMPGRIIQGLRTAGSNNPVFLLDEIDKLSKGIHGDPSAALLEVLDPEQNCTFTDHYLNVPFDLSQVLFIATANSVSTIPAALLDRMEIINVSGYTREEKLQIAVKHLLPKQFKEHGLSNEILLIPEDSIKILILSYTREAGVRSLERKVGALCRAVAVKVAEMRNESSTPRESSALSVSTTPDLATPPEFPIVLDENAVEDILGPRIYENEMSSRLGQPGVAVGLAWTAVGGDIMFVEATCVYGDGHLYLTGQLGDVMKESAKLALNWVRTHYASYGIKLVKGADLMDGRDVHIHFPAGAVEKDGPSAGVTIVSVLVSLFTRRCVASDVAMTGEMTLRGLVLPVGGIKEKVLAALRAGIRRVILPSRNQKDLHDIPDTVQKSLSFVFATHVDDVLQAAFEGGFPGSRNHMDQIVPSNL